METSKKESNFDKLTRKEKAIFKIDILRRYYPTGELSEEITMINDIREGRYRQWYKEGHVMEEGDYSNGKKHGRWVYWRGNGRSRYENIFIRGKNVYEAEYDEYGEIRSEKSIE